MGRNRPGQARSGRKDREWGWVGGWVVYGGVKWAVFFCLLFSSPLFFSRCSRPRSAFFSLIVSSSAFWHRGYHLHHLFKSPTSFYCFSLGWRLVSGRWVGGFWFGSGGSSSGSGSGSSSSSSSSSFISVHRVIIFMGERRAFYVIHTWFCPIFFLSSSSPIRGGGTCHGHRGGFLFFFLYQAALVRFVIPFFPSSLFRSPLMGGRVNGSSDGCCSSNVTLLLLYIQITYIPYPQEGTTTTQPKVW